MIRIEIGAMPPLLRSIVSSALATERDIAVMPPRASERRASGARDDPAAGRADVLIVCSDREPDGPIALRQLLGQDAPAILAIDSEGSTVTIVRVTTQTSPIAAAADLCEAVRRAAGRHPRTTN